jgi:hypothetical protein
MNFPLVNKIVDTVLYEGYILYPYRPSSKKNRQRFTFGRVYPHAYSFAQRGAEPFLMQTQCLATSQNNEAFIEVDVRFLHLMTREVLCLPEPLPDLPENLNTTLLEVVPELNVEGRRYLTWEEAVERRVSLPPRNLRRLSEGSFALPIDFKASDSLEPIRNLQGSIMGLLRRRQEAVALEVQVTAEALGTQIIKITTGIFNHTPVSEADLNDQNAVLRRTFASTHTILHLEGAEFVSLIDPPLSLKEFAKSCRNEGTWPVLVGDEEVGDHGTMLSSPIILYDYPKIALPKNSLQKSTVL